MIEHRSVIGFNRTRLHLINDLYQLISTWMFMDSYCENQPLPVYETNSQFRKYVDNLLHLFIESVVCQAAMASYMAKHNAGITPYNSHISHFDFQQQYRNAREKIRQTLFTFHVDNYSIDQFISIMEMAVITEMAECIPDLDDASVELNQWRFIGAGDLYISIFRLPMGQVYAS